MLPPGAGVATTPLGPPLGGPLAAAFARLAANGLANGGGDPASSSPPGADANHNEVKKTATVVPLTSAATSGRRHAQGKKPKPAHRRSASLSAPPAKPSAQPQEQQPPSRRYAEIGNWKNNNRGDGFLEPYMAGLGPDAAADAEPSVLRSKRPMPRPRARPRPRTILTSDTDDDNDIDDDLVDDEEDDDSPDPGTAGRHRGAAAAHAA